MSDKSTIIRGTFQWRDDLMQRIADEGQMTFIFDGVEYPVVVKESRRLGEVVELTMKVVDVH